MVLVYETFDIFTYLRQEGQAAGMSYFVLCCTRTLKLDATDEAKHWKSLQICLKTTKQVCNEGKM